MPRLDMHSPEVWAQFAPQCGYSARELAKCAQASGTHLERCSKHLFGLPPQKALNKFRMLAAPEVLARELSVKVAANKLGFRQHSHFTREFKAFYGTAPCKFLALSQAEREALKFAVQRARADRDPGSRFASRPIDQIVGQR